MQSRSKYEIKNCNHIRKNICNHIHKNIYLNQMNIIYFFSMNTKKEYIHTLFIFILYSLFILSKFLYENWASLEKE